MTFYQEKILSRLKHGGKLIIYYGQFSSRAYSKKDFTRVPLQSVKALERRNLIEVESFHNRYKTMKICKEKI